MTDTTILPTNTGVEVIVNKVAQSGIQTLDLELYYPDETDFEDCDLTQFLFMGLILKEKDYRQQLQNFDYSIFKNKTVCIHCSANAIVPMWAYMLLSVHLKPFAFDIVFGTKETAIEKHIETKINAIDETEYANSILVIKGCGTKKIGAFAYIKITQKLQSVVKNLMFGEPCSTVPIYKRPKTQ